MKTTQITQSLVLHFGEMGSRWGLNRTLGQMYALIVLTEEPLNNIISDIFKNLEIKITDLEQKLH